MPKRFPPEFKRDVVAVARRPDTVLAEVCVDFDISKSTLQRWMAQADIDDGVKDGLTTVGAGRARRAAQTGAAVGDGERDPAPRGGVLRGGHAPKKLMPLVRDLATEGIPVVVTCEVLGFSPQAFYKAQARPYSDRDWDDAVLVNAIVDVHGDDPEFGYRFIADELEAAGHRASENRVHRLCREHKVWSTTTKKGRKGSPKRPGPACMTTSCNGTSPPRTSTGCG